MNNPIAKMLMAEYERTLVEVLEIRRVSGPVAASAFYPWLRELFEGAQKAEKYNLELLPGYGLTVLNALERTK